MWDSSEPFRVQPEALSEALKSDQTESGFDSARLPGELQLLDRFNRINGAEIRSTHQLRRFRVIQARKAESAREVQRMKEASGVHLVTL